jgi:hypothetical protein
MKIENGCLLSIGADDIQDGNFIVPEEVIEISSGVFRGYTNLTSITLPAGLTTIGRSAFWNCSGLTTINLPAGVTSLGDDAFRYCSGLTTINLPAGLTTIGRSAFLGCSGLTTITLPAGLTSIGGAAFYGCSSLTTIALPAGLTMLGYAAFSGCSGLTAINLPAGITTLGVWGFYGCSSLTAITLPAGLTILDDYAFYGCSGLTTITLPPGIKFNSSAFAGCDHLEMIIIDSDDPMQIEAIKAQLPPGLKDKVIAKSEHSRQQRRDEDSRDDVSPCDISLQHSNASVLLKVLSGFMAALGATALVLALAFSWTPAVAAASVVTGVSLLAGSYGLFKYANNPLAVPVVEEQAALSI